MQPMLALLGLVRDHHGHAEETCTRRRKRRERKGNRTDLFPLQGQGKKREVKKRGKKRRKKKKKAAESGRKRPRPCPSPASRAQRSGSGGGYLLQAPVLDVQLLGVDEVEELPVLLPAGHTQPLGNRPARRAEEGQSRPRAHLSMLLKVYCVPCLVSISKSKERVVVVPRAKLTKEISSKRMCTGGLCT